MTLRVDSAAFGSLLESFSTTTIASGATLNLTGCVADPRG